jgi:hypothetical protein
MPEGPKGSLVEEDLFGCLGLAGAARRPLFVEPTLTAVASDCSGQADPGHDSLPRQ